MLGEENELKEIIYLGAGIFCCFLDLSEMRRDSLMRQRLTDVAGACFRFCKKEPYSFGISVSSICIGVQDGLRQAYQQARNMDFMTETAFCTMTVKKKFQESFQRVQKS